jgi:hypothetical protein
MDDEEIGGIINLLDYQYSQPGALAVKC